METITLKVDTSSRYLKSGGGTRKDRYERNLSYIRSHFSSFLLIRAPHPSIQTYRKENMLFILENFVIVVGNRRRCERDINPFHYNRYWKILFRNTFSLGRMSGSTIQERVVSGYPCPESFCQVVFPFTWIERLGVL